MAEKIGSVWAIDIGNTSLKALRLSNESGSLQVIGFDHIHHGKILSGTGVKEQEKQELIALSLRQFVQQNEIGKDDIIVAVPSANSFARFVKLPPVEKKRIPEIVRFEASQQIPFDINAVVWDWQLMSEEAEAEQRVGIFAIKNEVVTAELEHYSRENLEVAYVQIAPMALYNYIVFDRPDLVRSDSQAVVVLNIGAENTDLVICTKSDVWQRTIAMGGNAFTKAIAETFKLSFDKAEKLKRTAPMSKYARQILQAMKPVFADLASEIQRSIGFYSSAHPNVKLGRIVALGGGTRMRGLLQYLQQSLQMPIERPDSFKKVGINPAVSAAKFHEGVCDFGVVYGLGIQALGLGRIESNLIPSSVARSMMWAGKTRYFVAAACIILVASILAFARALIDRASYSSRAVVREKIKTVLDTAKDAQSDLQRQRARVSELKEKVNKEFELFKYREIVPLLNETILKVLPNKTNNPEQAWLYEAFASGELEKVRQIDRKQREQLFVTGISVYYTQNLEKASFGSSDFETRMARGGFGASSAEDRAAAYLERRMAAQGDRAGAAARRPGRQVTGREKPAEDRGFIVTITGYSPYRQIGELLDPVGAQDDPNRWGLVTRLMNLDRVFDGNSPFELYKKADVKHFEIKTGEVALDAPMPPGVGVVKALEEGGAAGSSRVLVDPMTGEVISKQVKVDEQGNKVTDSRGNPIYEANDHWFVLNLKLRWKDSADSQGEEASRGGAPKSNARSRTRPTAGSRTPRAGF